MPFLGHITPLMHLSHFLSNQGFQITFMKIEQNQNIISANHENKIEQNKNIISANHENMFNQIRVISIPDGLPLGSFTYPLEASKLDHNQFQEVALGLEVSETQFLWITKLDLADGDNNDVFIRQFHERVKEHGKIVAWWNQKKVRAHPPVACFISHRGWNSTLEGVKNGLRFLCWPLFGDQFANQKYIRDELNIGLRLVKHENGAVTKENIKSSLIELMKNEDMKAKAQKLKEIVNKSIAEGGSSFTKLHKFTKAMKQ
ncbi:hypothetical protein LUZ60_005832 [Juncus effusus]|nr:hypothetical protein LUZ60_005832 [Juncus effusus]